VQQLGCSDHLQYLKVCGGGTGGGNIQKNKRKGHEDTGGLYRRVILIHTFIYSPLKKSKTSTCFDNPSTAADVLVVVVVAACWGAVVVVLSKSSEAVDTNWVPVLLGMAPLRDASRRAAAELGANFFAS